MSEMGPTGGTANGETSWQDRPYRRYQRTAIEITSAGNRKPANTEDEPDDVTQPVLEAHVDQGSQLDQMVRYGEEAGRAVARRRLARWVRWPP